MTAHQVNNLTVRDVERESIRAFLEEQASYLRGEVLDYGCGQQPYRDLIVRFSGGYTAYDRVRFPANISERDVGELRPPYDTVVCTQVAQYWPDPKRSLQTICKELLARGGHLVMTYPTTWAEVEIVDLWRYTRRGMEQLLDRAGLIVQVHEQRAVIDLGGFRLPLGYGVVAERA